MFFRLFYVTQQIYFRGTYVLAAPAFDTAFNPVFGRFFPQPFLPVEGIEVRMQLDRVDGIGKTVFLGDKVLTATLRGFFKALDEKKDTGLKGNSRPDSGPEQLKKTFISFLAGFSRKEIEGVLVNLMDDWGLDASEQTLMDAHIESHCARVHSLFKNM